jgi:hypothetical protein
MNMSVEFGRVFENVITGAFTWMEWGKVQNTLPGQAVAFGEGGGGVVKGLL